MLKENVSRAGEKKSFKVNNNLNFQLASLRLSLSLLFAIMLYSTYDVLIRSCSLKQRPAMRERAGDKDR